jgi:hypothetical protein
VHLGVETRQVEAVRDVLFVDLAEVFIAARGDKLDESGVSQNANVNFGSPIKRVEPGRGRQGFNLTTT